MAESINGALSEVGRELDARVAEVVMGVEVSRDRNRNGHLAPMVLVREPSQGIGRGHGKVWNDCPWFSIDIAAAFQVVEAMAAQGFAFTLNYDAMPWDANCTTHRAMFIAVNVGPSHPAFMQHFEGHANAGPLAICLAALKAIEAASPDTTEK